ncbi:hypothetical protein ABT124_07585 [Streptomyces sp. NPDC001982]|uniref:hypothetical protein n=1 Tax=Streptomyces sp. NPDC001982 TaxID=3154405 RepID=UPI0033177D09
MTETTAGIRVRPATRVAATDDRYRPDMVTFFVHDERPRVTPEAGTSASAG